MSKTVTDTITLGTLQLVGVRRGPFVDVSGPDDIDGSGFHVTTSEWLSLVSLSDLQKARDLELTRTRTALLEALDGWDAERANVRRDPTERSAVLRAFLNGERDGL